jgi:long-chain acyl-CoA synthetase
MDKHHLWRQNWPEGLPTRSAFPYGRIPIADCLKKQAENTPHKIAINFYGREVTFAEWDEAADRLACALADNGYKKGDSVILYMHNCPQWCMAYIAAARLGLIIFTADSSFKQYELEYEINDSGARLIFAMDDNYPEVKAVRDKTGIEDVIITSFCDYLPAQPTLPTHPIMAKTKQVFPNTLEFLDLLQQYPPLVPNINIEPSEEELVLYTGGTTGLPKGCVHTHENTLLTGAYTYQVKTLGSDLSPSNSALIFVPMSHIAALSCGLFPSCVHGKTQVVLVRYDPLAAMQAIQKYRIEHVPAGVPLFKALLAHPAFKEYDLSSVKLWEAGEWMVWVTPDFAKQWEDAVGCPIVKAGYGMSEIANHMLAGNRIGYEIPFKSPFLMGTVPPDEGIDIRIADFVTHEDLPLGTQGEIVIKSPARCKCYWNKPKETAKLLTPDGWFYTGDVGMLDEEGYLYWYGRKKYLIRVSGFQVSPGEIEMIGRKNPDIANIAIVGIPDDKKGQIPKAFVQLVPQSRATKKDLEEWFKKHIAAYKVPTVEIRTRFPLTRKGSIDMKKLLEDHTS